MKKLVAIIGMPGSGKSEAAAFFREKGMQVLRFGDIVEDGLKEEGLERTAEAEKGYREKIRKDLGMEAIAIKMLPRIQQALQIETPATILDGLYSWEEYIYLQQQIKQLYLLCIYARPGIRYARLESRKIRSFTNKEARQRDIDEIEGLNKGGPIAIADYLIKNETSKENLQNELELFLETIANDTY